MCLLDSALSTQLDSVESPNVVIWPHSLQETRSILSPRVSSKSYAASAVGWKETRSAPHTASRMTIIAKSMNTITQKTPDPNSTFTKASSAKVSEAKMIQISALASPDGSRGNARAASVRAHRNTSSTKTSNAICTPRTPKFPVKFSSATSVQRYNVSVCGSVAAARVDMHVCARTCHLDRVQAYPTESIAKHCE